MNDVETIDNPLNGSARDYLQDARAINKTVCQLIAAKTKGQDLVIGDAEAFGMMLILEQMGMKIDQAEQLLGGMA